MAEIDLKQYGITGTTEIVHNPSYEMLFAEETKPELTGYEKGQVSELGAVNVMTGIYTGRSPKLISAILIFVLFKRMAAFWKRISWTICVNDLPVYSFMILEQ